MALGACRGSSGEAETGAAGEAEGAVSAAPPADPASVPRRPSRRYYLARTEARCEVYSVEADTVLTPTPTPCPTYLEPGERVRLTGRTCMREGRPQREQPVMCPEALREAERLDREPRPL